MVLQCWGSKGYLAVLLINFEEDILLEWVMLLVCIDAHLLQLIKSTFNEPIPVGLINEVIEKT